MSSSVLAALAGVLVAVAATGLMTRQCVRRPQAGIVLWAAAGLALVVALLAQIAGFASGFTPVTFRAVQLGAQFAAPLWLAWGLAEIVLSSGAVRFGVRLGSAAITAVAGVMAGTDPLTAAPFARSWPPASVHFQFVAHEALLFTQVVAVLMALTVAGSAALRARGGPAGAAGTRGTGDGPAVPASAAVAGAVLATSSLRFALPANPAYPLLCGLAAGLAWFAMSRVGGTGFGLSAAWKGWRGRRYESDDPAYVPRDETAVRGWRGRDRDAWDEPRGGRRGARDDRDWYEQGPDDRGFPGDGYRDPGYDDRGYGYQGAAMSGSGYRQPARGGYEPSRYDQAGPGARGDGRADYPPGGYGRDGDGRNAYAPGGADYGSSYGADAYDGAGYEGPPAAAGAAYGRRPRPDAGAPAPGPGPMPGRAVPPARGAYPGADGYPAAAGQALAVQANAAAIVPAGRPYGRISIFTLLDDRAAEFDQLAEQTAEAVRVAEPDTLVYVIHLVPKAPMQRIFYEIYRDSDAFDLHERQPHNQRFAAERRAYVLATNIIELRLKYAKVAPLSPAVSQKPSASRQPQMQRNGQMPRTPRGQLPPSNQAPRPPAPNRGQPSGTGRRYGG